MLAKSAGFSEHSNKAHITELPKFCKSLYILVDLQASQSRKLQINYNFLMFITNGGANYMQQSPSEANSSSASQEIPWIWWNPKLHFLSQD